MLKFSQFVIRCTGNNGRFKNILRQNNFSSSSNLAEARNATSIALENNVEVPPPQPLRTRTKTQGKDRNNIVAAAFASLNSDTATTEIKTPFTDQRIKDAKSIDELLSISEGNGVSRRHALKVVSVLADWSTNGKVKLSEFENDSRFLRLCRILTKGVNFSSNTHNKNTVASRSEDLSTILSVTADDEAAKLIENITLSQMVKVMSTLALRKRRSTLLLRALSYNITACTDNLNLKQSSDLLYSMSILNFVDDNLMARVSNDVCLGLKSDIKKSAVIGSILTSIGLLKYKDPTILDTLAEWIIKSHTICRPQDIFSLFMTLAVLNYLPSNSEELFKVLLPQLTPSEARKQTTWLEIVWSLALLNQANEEHINSVLSEDFISSLEANKNLTTSAKLKLLNIDSVASYILKDYKGSRIPANSQIRNTKITRTFEKTEMVESVIDSLRNLIQGEQYVKSNINTGLGFYIDAECLLDNKCNPLPLMQDKDANFTRIAILAYDYHDMCRGKIEPTGINVFATRLLKAKGYRILDVPYTDFKPRDKLIHRVQYLESKLKEVVKN